MALTDAADRLHTTKGTTSSSRATRTCAPGTPPVFDTEGLPTGGSGDRRARRPYRGGTAQPWAQELRPKEAAWR